MFTAKERLMLDAEGKVVKEGDPKAKSLLVAVGQDLSDEDAKKYGLVDAPKDEKDEKDASKSEKPEGKDDKARAEADKSKTTNTALPLPTETKPALDKAFDKSQKFGGDKK